MIATILYAVIALGMLIFIHELGHFIFAKLNRIGVITFSMGFGKKIVGRKIGDTEYVLSAIPFGGYVKMIGEEIDEDVREEDVPRSFAHASIFRRMEIVAAGPFFNFLLAVFIFWGIFIIGVPTLTTDVGEVLEDYPAKASGIRKGDKIIAINGRGIWRWTDLKNAVTESKGSSLIVTVLREDQRRTMTIVPKVRKEKNLFGEDIQAYLIGIEPAYIYRTERFGPLKAFVLSLKRTWEIGRLTVVGVIKIIQRRISAKTLGGPILIGKIAGEQAKQGPLNYFFFIALLSVNLGILNLLPIPILDGGHLLFLFIEILIGKPLNVKMRGFAQQVGLFLLILIMALAFYNDIARIFIK